MFTKWEPRAPTDDKLRVVGNVHGLKTKTQNNKSYKTQVTIEQVPCCWLAFETAKL